LLPFLKALCQEEHHGRAPNSSLHRHRSFSGVRQFFESDVHVAVTDANSLTDANPRRDGGFDSCRREKQLRNGRFHAESHHYRSWEFRDMDEH
jgi:hypothetical protein